MAKKVRGGTVPRPAVQAAQTVVSGGNGPTPGAGGVGGVGDAGSAGAGGASAAAAAAGPGRKPRLNRRDFKFAVFVGKSPKVAAWCRTEAEVAAFLATVRPNRLVAVDVGVLRPVAVKVSAQIEKLA